MMKEYFWDFKNCWRCRGNPKRKHLTKVDFGKSIIEKGSVFKDCMYYV